ncbi:MAG: aminopeptidase [Candidatus Hadarchaeales archaeon]
MSDLMEGARKVIGTCMGVRKGEKVLVVTDPPRAEIGRAIQMAALESGARCLMICMGVTRRHGDEPPGVVSYAMRKYDVVIAPTTFSLTHTRARREATKSGARIATMPMITEDMMKRGAMLADYRKVSRLTKRLAAKLEGGEEIEVTTDAGTDLLFSIRGRRAYIDTGIYHNPGEFGNLPAGEVAFAPVEGTGWGRVVIDGSMAGGNLGKVEIEIRGGRATGFSGKPAEKIVKMLRSAGPSSTNLAEFGIGTNPSARLIGNVLEDEKVLGTCHVALGDNSSFGGRVKAGIHIDGIFRKPTVKVDGKVLMKRGRFVGVTPP